MKTLYLMCGLSFSGKSTLAASIVEKLRCPLISLDAINHERGVGFGGDGIPVEEWERTHAIAIARMEEHMRGGIDLVLDDTNCFRWLRDRFRAVATRHGYRTLVVYLDIPLPVLRGRMLKNEATRERLGVKESIFADLAREFEVPQPDELTVTFTADDSVEEWIGSWL